MNHTAKVSCAPLDVCLLVDYRLSSRTLIKEQVSTTKIFGEVYEEGAMSVGLELVNTRKVEACLFGPSVKPEKIQDFIEATKSSSYSPQCAFMVFQPKDRQQLVPAAHSVVDFPASQPYFNAGLVQALSGAHGGSIPELSKRDPQTGEVVSLRDNLARLDFPGKEPKAEQGAEAKRETWPREVLEEAIKRFPILCDRLSEVEPYYLKFKIDGSPSDFTRNAIKEIVDEVFTQIEAVPAMYDFKQVLEQYLFSWIKCATLHGRAIASAALRRDILSSFIHLPRQMN